jgi:Redoxin
MKKIILLWLLIFAKPALSQTQHLKVYITIAENCPICNQVAKALKYISAKYTENVVFYAVFPFENSNKKTVTDFLKMHDLQNFQYILDSSQKTTKSLGATVTPEAIILNDSNEVLYRGRINDLYSSIGKRKHSASANDLDINLKMALQNIVIPQPWREAIGCFINFSVNE